MTGFPIAHEGMRIGLLGGSFDPPHAGHVNITQAAFRRFRLDRVWWLVSPGNPLKTRGPAPLGACTLEGLHPWARPGLPSRFRAAGGLHP